jgi:hypothetical protein
MEKVRINTEGQQGRKDLVYKIGELVGVAPTYTGAGGNVVEGERFRFSYVVMNITVAQDCTVVWDERTDAETMDKVFDGLERAGYEFERPALETAETPKKRKGIMDILVEELNANEKENGGTGEEWSRLHTTPTMECGDGRWRNLDGTFATVTDDHGGEYDENGKYIKGTGESVCFPEDGMSADDVPTMLTIELPATNVKEDILRDLIESKATIIKAALGGDGFGELPIEFDGGEGKVAFNWLRFGADAEVIQAWSAFLAAACKFAKTAKRVTAKDAAVENEKFAFRTFMVKIGMNGAEDKAFRKTLMRNLKGDAAFATPESKQRWLAKHGKQAGNTEVADNETAE